VAAPRACTLIGVNRDGAKDATAANRRKQNKNKSPSYAAAQAPVGGACATSRPVMARTPRPATMTLEGAILAGRRKCKLHPRAAPQRGRRQVARALLRGR